MRIAEPASKYYSPSGRRAVPNSPIRSAAPSGRGKVVEIPSRVGRFRDETLRPPSRLVSTLPSSPVITISPEGWRTAPVRVAWVPVGISPSWHRRLQSGTDAPSDLPGAPGFRRAPVPRTTIRRRAKATPASLAVVIGAINDACFGCNVQPFRPVLPIRCRDQRVQVKVVLADGMRGPGFAASLVATA